jgi:hypothetical protein
MRLTGRRSLLASAAVGLSLLAVATQALGDLPGVTGPAALPAPVPASPIGLGGDMVTVFQSGTLTTAVRDRALVAARVAGAPATTGRGFTIGLWRVIRNGVTVKQASQAGWAFPMGVTALPGDAIGATMGRNVSGNVGGDRVVMGATGATVAGIQAGDLLEVWNASNGISTLRVSVVADDSAVGGAEILMTTDQATNLGYTIDTRVLVYGQFERARLETALYGQGLLTDTKVRVRRSWDAFDPDLTIGIARTKQTMGEFDYAHLDIQGNTSGWVSMSATWIANYLRPRETYPTGIQARCNREIHDDLVNALDQVVAAGLAGAIDVANTNSFGGCGTGQVRFSRNGTALGSISRHSWAMALDTNTVTNCQGCVPQLDCRVVRIFRANGFAWGGNFLTPDGMHFEWVGEPRHTYTYPSKYCPNTTPPTPTERLDSIRENHATFFAEDGASLEAHDH